MAIGAHQLDFSQDILTREPRAAQNLRVDECCIAPASLAEATSIALNQPELLQPVKRQHLVARCPVIWACALGEGFPHGTRQPQRHAEMISELGERVRVPRAIALQLRPPLHKLFGASVKASGYPYITRCVRCRYVGPQLCGKRRHSRCNRPLDAKIKLDFVPIRPLRLVWFLWIAQQPNQ